MRYLVTTSHALLSVDSANGAIEPVHSGDGLYYGITSDDRFVYVAARRRLVSAAHAREDERGCILVFTRDLVPVDVWEAPFPLRDMHQILWWRGRLWISCTFDNLIAMTDGRSWQRWYPAGLPRNEPYDTHHFNSLTAADDRLVVLAHNHGRSELHFFDAETLRLLDRFVLGHQAHNVWRHDGEWLTCNSGKRGIVGSHGFRLRAGRFPRGHASTREEIAIGLSERTERHRRDYARGTVNIYDRRWRLRKRLDLGHCGLVLDIHPWQAGEAG